jgi:hypothetical protein
LVLSVVGSARMLAVDRVVAAENRKGVEGMD